MTNEELGRALARHIMSVINSPTGAILLPEELYDLYDKGMLSVNAFDTFLSNACADRNALEESMNTQKDLRSELKATKNLLDDMMTKILNRVNDEY